MANLGLFEFSLALVRKIEQEAAGLTLEEVLQRLRKLSMEDFGKVLIFMPHPEFPNLSRLLPRMASPDVQLKWTGNTGLSLLSQTVAFARILETSFVRHVGRRMHGATILDFGVGYGRNVRSMLYYTDPQNIFGIDAWQSSLDYSIRDGVPGNLLLSDQIPTSLPVANEIIDISFALSIFTHLSKESATACLSAIRKTMKKDGIGIFTIRPKEFWNLTGQAFSAVEGATLLDRHEAEGLAFYPYAAGGTYGDTTMEISFFDRQGWSVLGYETSMTDPYQISVVTAAV